ncbi:MAG TPA: hypothetical protein VNF27_05695 [Candidatus Binataceae bacterium]|nr:hypothetical protein [Candidatus Binataceae bacterium]
MDTLTTLGAIAAIGVFGVLLPVGLSVFAEFSKPKDVICPENGAPARVTVDATYVALTSVAGMNRLRLTGCSRWPERAACNQSCLNRLAN